MNGSWSPEGSEAARPRTSWRIALVVAIAGLLVWKIALPSSASLVDPDTQPRTVEARGDLAEDERATIELFERASPSVVYIRNLAYGFDGASLNPAAIREGQGSGFVWDDRGHVVTNYHVIHGSRQLEVTLASHETYDARVVGFEIEKDIAVLRIDVPDGSLADRLASRAAKRPVPIALGSSADLKVGQKVFAIGNPFGLDHTLTTGIVSGLGREMPSRFEEEGRGQRLITDLIQTDAAINQGNSGGPLLDSAGRLIGMNTSIVSVTGGFSGVGFAIPVDTINRIVTEILRFGKARRPGLGVQVARDAIAQGHEIEGVVIARVIPDSAADRAGLKATPGFDPRRPPTNDIIVAIDGVKVRNSNDLFRELDHKSVGDRVKLTVLRGGKNGNPIDVEVKLQDMQEN